jgi:hypothetical protein
MMGKTCSRVLAAFRAQKRMLLLGAIGAVLIIAFGLSEDWRLGIPPSFVMVWAGLLCGSGPVGRVHFANEFLLSRAVYRHEVFSASALVAFVNAILIASAMLVFPTWTASRGSYLMLDVHPPALALTSWILIFAISWSVIVLLQVKMDYHEYLDSAVVVFGTMCCVIAGGLATAFKDVGVLDLEASATGSVVIFLILSAIAFKMVKWAFDTYCYTDPGAWTVSGGRATPLPPRRLAQDVQRPKHAAGTRASILPAKSRPDKVRYLKPLIWLEFSHWARQPALWFWAMWLVASFTILTQFSILFVVCFILQFQFIPDPSPYKHPFPREFVFSIALPKHLHFRTKTASFILLIGFVAGFAALLSWVSQSESTLLLTNRAAETIGAEPSAEGLDWDDRMLGGFLLVPRSLYGNYTVSGPSITSGVANGCLAVLYYSLAWLLWGPFVMSQRFKRQARIRKQRGFIRNGWGLYVMIVAFLFFGGPLVAWAFVLAYTHPLCLILGTAAVCLLLLRLAERQFVNCEAGG